MSSLDDGGRYDHGNEHANSHHRTRRRLQLARRWQPPRGPAPRRRLAGAQIYWLSTVRTDGRPHVTPIIAVWDHGAVHFCTGPEEQKAKNLATHADVVVTTGTNAWSGLDVVVEGAAVRVTDDNRLGELAMAWETKYGEDWHFDVASGTFRHHGDDAHVFGVEPRQDLRLRPRRTRLGHPLPLLTSARRSATNQMVCCDRPTDRTHRSTPPPIT